MNKHWHGYICIIANGEIFHEKLGDENEAVAFANMLSDIPISLFSAHFNAGNDVKIELNYRDCAVGARGLNILVVDISLSKVFDSVCFDTHENGFPVLWCQ